MASFNLPFGVRVSNENPLDADRYIAANYVTRDNLLTQGRAYEGLQVYVEDTKELFILKSLSPATWELVGSDPSALSELKDYVDGSLNIKANDASLDLYVLKAGDTMTGPLILEEGLNVTGDTSVFGGLYVDKNTAIKGNLTINGSLYIVDVGTLDVSTGYVRLNTGLEGTPPLTLQSGIVVERGDEDPYIFVYDESNQTFRIGIAELDGTTYKDEDTQAVATREDAPESLGIAFWNATLNRFDTASDFTVTSWREWNEAQDTSILMMLKEASLGDNFKWVNGLLDISLNTIDTSRYTSVLEDGIKTDANLGGIPADTDVATLKGKTYDELWDMLLFPTMPPTIFTARSAALNWPAAATVEVGTVRTGSATATYNPGLIRNGDKTNGPALTGNANHYTFKLPDGTTDHDTAHATNSLSHSFTSYNVGFGNNTWTVEISYDAGTGAYYDNKGVPQNIFDASRVAGSIIASSGNVIGRRRAWHGSGAVNSHPTISSGVRSLPGTLLLDASNEATFDITIPANTPEVYLYIPSGKDFTAVYVQSSNANVRGAFTISFPVTVEDAGGTGQSYTGYVSNFGGYPEVATYRVSII